MRCTVYWQHTWSFVCTLNLLFWRLAWFSPDAAFSRTLSAVCDDARGGNDQLSSGDSGATTDASASEGSDGDAAEFRLVEIDIAPSRSTAMADAANTGVSAATAGESRDGQECQSPLRLRSAGEGPYRAPLVP